MRRLSRQSLKSTLKVLIFVAFDRQRLEYNTDIRKRDTQERKKLRLIQKGVEIVKVR
jgi:hypothetical protein